MNDVPGGWRGPLATVFVGAAAWAAWLTIVLVKGAAGC